MFAEGKNKLSFCPDKSLELKIPSNQYFQFQTEITKTVEYQYSELRSSSFSHTSVWINDLTAFCGTIQVISKVTNVNVHLDI